MARTTLLRSVLATIVLLTTLVFTAPSAAADFAPNPPATATGLLPLQTFGAATPTGWTNGGTRPWTYTGATTGDIPATTGNYAVVVDPPGGNANATSQLTTPIIDLTGANRPILQFDLHSYEQAGSNTVNASVVNSTFFVRVLDPAGNLLGTVHTIADTDIRGAEGWLPQRVDLTGYVGQQVTLRFDVVNGPLTATAYDHDVGLDNVRVDDYTTIIPGAVNGRINTTSFLPVTDDQIVTFNSFLENADCTQDQQVGDTTHRVVSVVIGQTRPLANGQPSSAIILYDQIEDGLTSTSVVDEVTDELWGDGNQANGFPPGHPEDLLFPGDLIILDTISAPGIGNRDANLITETWDELTNGTTLDYDGGDRMTSNAPIVVSEVAWNDKSSTLLAGAVEVLDTTRWGTSYTIPVGADVVGSRADDRPFEYVGVSVMAQRDGTVVTLPNGQTETLDAGESAFYLPSNENGFPDEAGNKVIATAPVGVTLLTGDNCQSFESRWYSLYPDSALSNEYYASPATTLAGTSVETMVIYNPNPNPITVTIKDRTTTSTLTVAANSFGQYRQSRTTATVTKFSSTQNFIVALAYDYDTAAATAGNEGGGRDWGYILPPADQITPILQAGLALGVDPTFANVPANAALINNPIFLGAVWNGATAAPVGLQVCIDWNGDGGANTTGGRGYDHSYSHVFGGASDLVTFRIDEGEVSATPAAGRPRARNDLSGSIMFVCNPANPDDARLADWRLVGAWGEDETGDLASPTLDAGTAILSIPTFDLEKSAVVGDTNGNTVDDAGDTIDYTIDVTNASVAQIRARDLKVWDALPSGVEYVPGSTTVQGVAVPDDPSGTPFPLDDADLQDLDFNDGGVVGVDDVDDGVWNVAPVEPGGTFSVSFQAEILDTARVSIINTAYAFDGRTQYLTPVVTALSDPVTIGNLVWLDEDGDGVQDAGEDGVANVPVSITYIDPNTGQSVTRTTVTDTDGGYVFTGLPIPTVGNTFVVTITPPAGMDATGDEDGTADNTITLVSDPQGADAGNPLTIQVGDEHETADFGLNWVPPVDTDTNTGVGAIGDRIWSDADGDGIQDPGEPGLPGVPVTLFADPDGDGVYDTVVATTTTDAAGGYIFDDLPPGAYVVEVTTPPAGTQTGDPDATLDNRSQPIPIAPGDVYGNADFGYQGPTGSIGDTIFVDLDGDGIEGPTEPGIAGVTIALLDANGVIVATTTTDANGNYLFTGVPGGAYSVEVTDTDNVIGLLTDSSDPDGTLDRTTAVTLPEGGSVVTADFGFAPNPLFTLGESALGDTVFLDRDGDGVPGPGEGIEGVTVTVTNSLGLVIATLTTDENGTYFVGGLPADTYTVDVVPASLPAGLTNTVDPDAETPNASEVILDGVTDNLEQDFGYRAAVPNTVGGTLWEDVDADGILDPAEADRFAGVTVVLTDAAGKIVGTTTTDATGNYAFTGLADGTYTVTVTDDANVVGGFWHSDAPTPGTDGQSQDDQGFTVSVAGGQTNTTADFGYYIVPGSVGDQVFNDVDADGVFTPGVDTPIPGVQVVLTTTYPDGTVVTQTVVTDVDGIYEFPNLLLDEDFNAATDTPGGTLPVFSVSIPDGQAPLAGLSSIDDGTPDAPGYNPDGTPAGTDGNGDDPSGELAFPAQGQADTTNDFGFGIFPSIDIVKTAGASITDQAADGTVYGPVEVGDTVTYSFVVTNDGSTPLTDVLVVDPMVDGATPGSGITCVGVTNGAFDLDIGSSVTCTATYVVVPADFLAGTFTNTASVSGEAPGGDPADPTDDITDSDPADVLVVGTPGVTLVKKTNGADNPTAPGVAVAAGSLVTWTYEATNTGNTSLDAVTVTDDNGTVDPADDFTVTDADLTSGDANANGLLDPGETWILTATGTAVVGQYVNNATVTGTPTDPVGTPIPGLDPPTDDDDDGYFGADPSVALVKLTNGTDNNTAPGIRIPAGSTVTWTYQATNDGNIALTDVSLVDDNGTPTNLADDVTLTVADLVSGDTDGNEFLDPGETWVFEATGTAVIGQYRNTATVTGTPEDPTGNTPPGLTPPTDTDVDNYLGINADLTLVKKTNGIDHPAAPGDSVATGSVVTWTYEATNNGLAPLADVTLVDDNGTPADPADDFTLTVADLVSGDTDADGILDPGETWILEATGTAIRGQYTNIATVTGTPVDANGDPDPGIDPPVAIDDDHYFGYEPEVALVKLTNGTDNDTAPGALVVPGSTVTWTYQATNPGNIALADVTLVDDNGTPADPADDITLTVADLVSGDTNADGQLDPGETWIFEATGIAIVGPYVNNATVTGTPTDPGGNTPPGLDPPTDDDDDRYYGSDPSIALVKKTNDVDNAAAPGSYVTPGSVVTWTYEATNDGDTALADVSLVDDNGTPADPADDFTLTVADLVSGDTDADGILDPGETWILEATGTAILGQYANNASVTGTPVDPAGTPIPGIDPPIADDDDFYFGLNAAIALVKKTNGVDYTAAPGAQILAGNPAIWTYEATNTGNVALASPTLVDDNGTPADPADDFTLTTPLSGDVDGDGALDPGETWIFTATAPATPGQYQNTATVTGTPVDPAGTPIPGIDPPSATDDDFYFGGVDEIDIEKATDGEDADEAPGPRIPVDGAVTWTYVVTNSGNRPFDSVVVTDDQVATVTPVPSGADPTRNLGDVDLDGILDPGEVWQFSATGIAVEGQYTNVGTVVGTRTDGTDGFPGGTATDDDPSNYFGTAASLALTKVADVAQYAAVGDVITYTYTLTNDGNIGLVAPFSVTDDHIPNTTDGPVVCPQDATAVGNGDAVLDPGESLLCEGVYTVTAADLNAGSVTNIATATANDPRDPGDPDDDEPVDSPPDDETVTSDAFPSIDIVKTADVTSGLELGDTVTYTFLVTNDGPITLDFVTVTDPLPGLSAVTCGLPDLNGTASLDPGETLTCEAVYEITQADVDAGRVDNVATVTGEGPDGDPDDPTDDVTDEDPETVTTLSAPALTIDKTVYAGHDDGASAPGGELVVGVNGDPVTYVFTVTNTGNIELTDVTVDDADLDIPVGDLILLSGDPRSVGVGETVVWYFEGVIDGDLVNSATSTGTPPGTPVPPPVDSPPDTAEVDEVDPAIEIIKTAGSAIDSQVADGATYTAPFASTVTYVLSVTNTGDTDLATIEVADPLCDAAPIRDDSTDANADDVLSVGETWDYSCTTADVRADVTNVATATGNPVYDDDDDPLTPPVDIPTAPSPTDDDDAIVDVSGAVSVDKADPTVSFDAATGIYTLRYVVTVTNDGADTIYSLSDTIQFSDAASVTGQSVELIESASTTPFLPSPTWDGAGDPVIVTDQPIGADTADVFAVTVTATVDPALVTEANADCGLAADETGTGFLNSATVIADGTTTSDTGCAPLPDPAYDITKSIASGPTSNGDGTYSITYSITVQNIGDGPGSYDLVDAFAFGEGITPVAGSVVVGNTTPGGLPVNAAFDGVGDQTIATGVAIGAGASHVYTVSVTADATAVASATARDCALTTDETGTGLRNVATVIDGPTSLSDDVCAPVPGPQISIDKTVQGTPVFNANGDAPDTFTTTYLVRVTNAATSGPGSYTLVDALRFPAGATVVSASAAAADAGSPTPNAGWNGSTDQVVIGTATALAPGETDSFLFTVEASVAASVTTAVRDCVLSTTETASGFDNSAAITVEGVTTADDACAPIPPPEFSVTKRVTNEATVATDGTFTGHAYEIIVTNGGLGAGLYDLVDTLRFGAGITVSSATITDPDGNPVLTWDGTTNTVVVTGRALDAQSSETYTIVVDGSLAGVTSVEAGDCVLDTGETGTGLRNEVDVRFEGQIVSSADACEPNADPVFDITKTFLGANTEADGTHTVTYSLTVRNTGGEGTYDLTDGLRFGAGVEVLGAQVSQAPAGVTVNGAWDGLADVTVTTGAFLGAGGTHVYRITVSADSTAASVATDRDCVETTPGEPTGFSNDAGVTWTGGTDVADACGPIPDPAVTVAKTLTSGPTRNADGNYDLTYEIVVTNGGEGGDTYDLDDTFGFGAGVTIVGTPVASVGSSIATNVPTLVAGWNGQDATTLADDQPIVGGARHTYTISVTADAAGVTTLTARDCVLDPGEIGTGFRNDAALTPAISDPDDADACAPIPAPELSIAKSVSSQQMVDDDTVRVTYLITVTNAGDGSATYDIADTFRFGEGVTVSDVAIGATVPATLATNGAFAGSGTLVSGAVIGGGETQTVEVIVTADIAPTTAGTARDCVLDPGESGTGLLNGADLIVGGEIIDTEDACAPVPGPAIDFTKTAGTPVFSGDTVTIDYTLSVTNAGLAAGAYDLSDTLAFGEGVTDIVATASSDDVTVDGAYDGLGATTLVTGQSIGAGETQVITISVTARIGATTTAASRDCSLEPTEDGTGLLNQATLTVDGVPTDQDACAPIPDPDISVTKTVSSQPTLVAGNSYTVGYTIEVTNDGAASGVYDLSDRFEFGPGVTVTGVSVQAPTGTTAAADFDGAGQPVIAAGVSLGAGATDTWTVLVTFDLDNSVSTVTARDCALDPGESGTGLRNTADIATPGGDDSSTVCAPLPGPGIDITKTASATTALGGNAYSVDYTITVTNTGAGTNVYDLTDDFAFGANVQVTNVTASADDLAIVVNDAFDGAADTTLATGVSIEAGGVDVYTVTVTVDVTNVHATTEFDCALTGTEAGTGLLNGATVTTPSQTDQAEACREIPQVIDLELDKSVSATNLDLGEAFDWIITVTNQGPADATGVTVLDRLPAGVTYVSSTGAYNPDTGIWTIGDIAFGETVTLSIRVTADVVGIIENTAQVASADQPDIDSTPGNDDPTEDDQDPAQVVVTDVDGTTTPPPTVPPVNPPVDPPVFNPPVTPPSFSPPVGGSVTPRPPLAFTGSNVISLFTIGMVFLVLGALIVGATRRKRGLAEFEGLTDGMPKGW